MTLDELVAREEIRDLAARWNLAVNTADYEAFRSTWTEDAVWTFTEPFALRAEGPDAIVAKLRELFTGNTAFFQEEHGMVIDLAPDLASARATVGCTETARPGDGRTRGYYNHALYEDVLVRTAGGWRYKSRNYRYVYVDVAPRGGDWRPLTHP